MRLDAHQHSVKYNEVLAIQSVSYAPYIKVEPLISPSQLIFLGLSGISNVVDIFIGRLGPPRAPLAPAAPKEAPWTDAIS